VAVPPVFNFVEWVKDNEHLLKPPVNNRMMYGGDDFIVMVVGGPNQRTDFHVDPYEEWFYQVRGNMHVNIVEDGEPKTVHIREGDVWLLPGNLPHSPQRPEAGSVGIVIERIRREGTLEKFQWYCPQCASLVHEVSSGAVRPAGPAHATGGRRPTVRLERPPLRPPRDLRGSRAGRRPPIRTR